MDALKLAQHCDRVFDLSNAKLGDEYFYQSLPLCVIDAVFSIGVRYKSTQNVVSRYCDRYQLLKIRANPDILPSIDTQETNSAFLRKIDVHGIQYFTDMVFCNKQRTSAKNGILKTEAVYRFAGVLHSHKVETFQDISKIIDSNKFERDILLIPGQGSGISLKYFFMLAGNSNLIKPDRMIHRFLDDFSMQTHQKYQHEEATFLLQEAGSILSKKYPKITPRLLDYQIWAYQRSK